MKSILTLFALCSMAPAALHEGTVVVSTTEQSLASISGLSGVAARVTLRMLPGYSGKIYFGKQGMSTSNYANVARVLYPNATGGWSETYEVKDVSGRDGLELSNLYVRASIGGERMAWEIEQTGLTATYPQTLAYAGPLRPTAPNAAQCFSDISSATKMLVGLQLSVVPGHVGKIRVGRRLTDHWQPDPWLQGVGAVLWPNTGLPSPDSAHSETHEIFASKHGSFQSVNPLHGNNACAYPEVYGEFPLLAAWQRWPYFESFHSGTIPNYDVQQGPIALTGAPQFVAVGGAVGSKLTIKTMPGTYGKVYVGLSTMNTSTLAGVVKVIYPNPSGGHSDSYVLEYPDRAPGLANGVYVKGDWPGESILVTQEVDRLDSSSGRAWNLWQKTVALASWPTAITGIGKGASVAIRNVPGQCGKIYVGIAGMNTMTLTGVIKVLYPNCGGGIGDSYSVSFGEPNAINAEQFYVAGTPGEHALVEVRKSGWPEAATVGYQPERTGPMPIASGPTPPTVGTANAFGTKVQVSVVPGQVGKVRVGGQSFCATAQTDPSLTGVSKILWPNTGNVGQSNARSESIETTRDPVKYCVWPEVLGETPLVTTWRYY